MKTPIADYLKEYESVRLHMPGHKGAFSADDITEVKGADSLYEADGVISESEANASELFGTRATFYGTEGSSQMIKAMCYMACEQVKREDGECTPVILATRNAHRAFIHAAMLLRFEIEWIPSEDEYSLCSCRISPEGLKRAIESITEKLLRGSDDCWDNKKKKLAAIYVTSPDYLGNILDIEALSKVARAAGLLFMVDNAHGAYLRFLKEDIHPISIGADICCDSAHKTLPVLTGGAYLHIGKTAPEGIEKDLKQTLLLFGSTSPSYLILRSLDMANTEINKEKYIETADKVSELKEKLERHGFSFAGDEKLKLTFDFRGKTVIGTQFAELLRESKIECEFADPDFVVTMWSPWNSPEDYEALLEAARQIVEEQLIDINLVDKEVIEEDKFEIKKVDGLSEKNPALSSKLPEVRYQPWETLFRPKKRVKVGEETLGQVAADTLIGCPPAVSPIVAGEVVDKNVLNILQYYNVTEIEIIE